MLYRCYIFPICPEAGDQPPSSPLISRHDVMTPAVTPRDEPERPYIPELSENDIPSPPQLQVLIVLLRLIFFI